MRFLNRTVVVGSAWGILNTIFLVVPLYLYGTSLTSSPTSNSLVSSPGLLFTGYTFGPLPVFPVGLFVLGVSFICAVAIADIKGGIQALCFSEIIAFAVSPLLLIIFPSALTSLTPDGMIAFFGFVAVVFFLLGMVGTVTGSLLGMWMEEQPGKMTMSMSRHRAVLIVAILVMLFGTSSVIAESLITAQVQAAAAKNSIRYVGVVANQTLNWSTGVDKVSANFTLQGDEIEIAWTSSTNVSFHVLERAKPQYREESVYSCAVTDYLCSLYGCSANYCGYALESLNVATTYYSGDLPYVAAWFHNDACSGSGCPSGWVHYEMRMWRV